jgi:hypothetical protein
MNLPNFNLKKRLATATLGLALLTGTTLATIGIIPVQVAGINSLQKSEAASAHWGSCYRSSIYFRTSCWFPSNGSNVGVEKIVWTGGSGADVTFEKYQSCSQSSCSVLLQRQTCVIGGASGQSNVCYNSFGNSAQIRTIVTPHNVGQTTFFDLYY